MIKDLLSRQKFWTVVVPEELTDRFEVPEKMEQIAEEHGCHAGMYIAGGELFPWVYCDKKEIEGLNEAFWQLNIKVADTPLWAMPSTYKRQLVKQFQK